MRNYEKVLLNNKLAKIQPYFPRVLKKITPKVEHSDQGFTMVDWFNSSTILKFIILNLLTNKR